VLLLSRRCVDGAFDAAVVSMVLLTPPQLLHCYAAAPASFVLSLQLPLVLPRLLRDRAAATAGLLLVPPPLSHRCVTAAAVDAAVVTASHR
jgi:hypothetical protein